MKEHEWTILRCYFGMMVHVHVHTEHRLDTVEAASESKSVSLNQ